MIKQFALAAVLALGAILAECESNHHSNSINGTWNATLLGNNSSTIFAFDTSLEQNSDGSVTVVNFKFSSSSPCFVSGQTETGSFTLRGNPNGPMSGKFGMTVDSGIPSGNTLALVGTAAGSSISGNWTLTGSSGCSGSGTFSMTRG